MTDLKDMWNELNQGSDQPVQDFPDLDKKGPSLLEKQVDPIIKKIRIYMYIGVLFILASAGLLVFFSKNIASIIFFTLLLIMFTGYFINVVKVYRSVRKVRFSLTDQTRVLIDKIINLLETFISQEKKINLVAYPTAPFLGMAVFYALNPEDFQDVLNHPLIFLILIPLGLLLVLAAFIYTRWMYKKYYFPQIDRLKKLSHELTEEETSE